MQHVPQILGVRAIGGFGVFQAERLAGFLHEIHQLVDFEQRDERVHQSAEIAMHQHDQRRAPWAHVRHFARLGRHRRAVRLEDDDMEIVDAAQRRFDARAHVGPIQPAEAAAERRDGDGADAAIADLFDQRLQAGVDILHPALAAPMPLGWEVDDELRIGQRPGLEHEHLARLHLLPRAGGLISLEVRRKVILELKRDAAAHDADAVDRIDQRFRVGPQDVSGREFDHRHLPSVVPVSFDFDRRPMRGALHGASPPSARWPGNARRCARPDAKGTSPGPETRPAWLP